MAEGKEMYQEVICPKCHQSSDGSKKISMRIKNVGKDWRYPGELPSWDMSYSPIVWVCPECGHEASDSPSWIARWGGMTGMSGAVECNNIQKAQEHLDGRLP